MKQGMKKSRGFTLLELMFTLAVAGVLLVIAVPSFNAFMQNSRMATQTNDFVADLNIARSEAARRALPVVVVAKAGGGGANEWGPGWTIFVDADRDGVLDAGELFRDGEPLAGAMTLDNVGGVTTFQFASTGLSSVATTWNICRPGGGEGRQIEMLATGRLRTTTFNCP